MTSTELPTTDWELAAGSAPTTSASRPADAQRSSGTSTRTRAFVDDEVLPVINGYWERAEFPWPLVEKLGGAGHRRRRDRRLRLPR